MTIIDINDDNPIQLGDFRDVKMEVFINSERVLFIKREELAAVREIMDGKTVVRGIDILTALLPTKLTRPDARFVIKVATEVYNDNQ